MSKETLESLYRKYTDDTLKQKLEYYALWTIPSVFPKDSTHVPNGNAVIEHDYQSVGAMLVNRLATKLAGSLFPANASFFRIEPSEALKELLDRDGVKSLVELENTACRRLLYNASYAQLVQALRLLIITGDVLVKRFENKVRVFSLKNYVVRRNNVGEVQDIVIRECINYSELPDYIRNSIQDKRAPEDKLILYTRVEKITQFVGDIAVSKWVETQEVEGRAVNYEATYTDNLCPYIPITWNYVNGDMYGRGYVEEYAGDFAKLSELSQALTEYELNSCIVLNVYNPAGNFDVDRAVSSLSGDWITGNKDAVQAYEVGDYNKIQTLVDNLQAISQRLSVAFMSTSNQREGERVTATEVMQNATEAEQVLGGVYSQLSQNMHMPLAYLLLHEVQPTVINAVERGEFKLDILTGLQALSRSSENQSLLVAASEINAIVPIMAQLSKRFNPDKLIDSILRANGVNVDDYTYTEDEMKAMAAQEEQQAQQLAMQQQALQQGAGQEQAVQAVQQSQGII